MKNRLILLDGHSTVGKSSISKSVFEQLLKNVRLERKMFIKINILAMLNLYGYMKNVTNIP